MSRKKIKVCGVYLLKAHILMKINHPKERDIVEFLRLECEVNPTAMNYVELALFFDKETK